jgi:hypothetical protein
VTTDDLHDVEQYIDEDTLAVLDGELTEDQLVGLIGVSGSPTTVHDAAPAGLVSYDDRLPMDQFRMLCRLLAALLECSIDVDAIRATADEVILEYTTDAETAEARGDDIQNISVCYLALFDEEASRPWDDDPLPDLHIFGHEPARLDVWRIESDWAEAAMAGELERTEVRDRAIETIEGYS